MTYAKQTWTNNVTPVDAAHMNYIEDGIASLAAPAPSTTPPATPADGDIWYLPADANGTVWQFRYNAGSASAYKWEFIGGGYVFATVDTAETVGPASTWADVATVGPLLTLLRAGDYLVTGGLFWSTAPADVVCRVAPWKGTSAQGREVVATVWTSSYLSMVCSDRLNACAAGSDVRLRYWASIVTAANVANRWLQITPVRVS